MTPFSRLCTGAAALAAAFLMAVPLQATEQTTDANVPAEPKRIVSVGGGITETLFALGAESAIVGVDTSSVFPKEALELPKCGYQRNLAAEGVASLNPDLVILGGIAGPPSALEQMKRLGLTLVQLEDDFSLEATKGRIVEVAELVGRKEKATELLAHIDEKVAQANAIPRPEKPPRVLFLLSIHGGRTTVAGADTAADAMVKLVGGVNAADNVSSYKQVSAESIAAFSPDVILTTSRSVAQFQENGGMEKVVPGVNLTPAGKNNRIIVMDDLLLMGFGPRIGDAMLELATQLYSPGTAEGKAEVR